RAIREARRVGHAVMIVADRVDARAVAITRFGDAVECPQVAAAYREARRAIALHLDPAEILKQELGARDVLEELGAALIGRPLVAVAVARELVARVQDAAYERLTTLGGPAEGVDGWPRARCGERA